jgi:methionyl aminopeptidase
MRTTNTSLRSSELVCLKNQNWLDKQRIAGRVVANTLLLLEEHIKNKTQLSLIELNELAERYIYSQACTPTFKNYGGSDVKKAFPAGVCISVNNQLVHGVPTEYKLKDGDKVSFDLGATYESVIADSAMTLIFGTPKSEEHIKLISASEEALYRAIKSIAIGKKIGCIGHAIYKCARGHGYNVITQYGGHGISWNKAHDLPFISNKSELNEGIRAKQGLSIAIEPLLVIGNNTETKVLEDDWTVECKNLCSHHEHTLYLHDNYIEIITYRGNEKFLKSNKIYYNQEN